MAGQQSNRLSTPQRRVDSPPGRTSTAGLAGDLWTLKPHKNQVPKSRHTELL